MDVSELFKRGELFVKNNSPSLLTAVGVTGTVTTAVLTGRASFKAARILEDHVEEQRKLNSEPLILDDFTLQSKLRLVWPLYIPPVGVGGVTIASIVMANRIGSKRAAAMAAAYSISERAFEEYKVKVVERLGEKKEQAVRDEIAQDRVAAQPVITKEVIIAGTGEVLCFDNLTGRYFRSSIEAIKKAQNTVNHDIINHMYASLSQFYEEIGLPPTRYSDEVGWNTNALIDVVFSTTMSTDDQPCIVIDFTVGPDPNYTKLYN